MKTIDNVIYIPEFMFVLIAMGENKGGSMTDIHYKLKISYAFMHNMKKVFVDKNWISIQKDGLKHIPIITEQGRLVLNQIYSLLDVLEIKKEDVFKFRMDRKKVRTKPGEKDKVIEQELIALSNVEVPNVDIEVVGEDDTNN